MNGRLLRWLGGAAMLGFLLAAFTPAVGFVGSRLDPDRPPERAEAIVVPGAGGVTAAGTLTDRSLRGAMQGVTLFRQGWAPVLVLSGSVQKGRRTEAEARADFARQAGFLLMLAVTTSLLAALLVHGPEAGTRALGRAVAAVPEMAGIAALFLAANLALGAAVVLAIRGASSVFVSIYLLNDISLVALSIVQGAVFFCWRRRGAG